ncbi:8682_t:CDS:2, partial [Acaulospora morrowiae]
LRLPTASGSQNGNENYNVPRERYTYNKYSDVNTGFRSTTPKNDLATPTSTVAPTFTPTSTVAPTFTPTSTVAPTSAVASTFTPTSSLAPTFPPNSALTPTFPPNSALTPTFPPTSALTPTFPPKSALTPTFPPASALSPTFPPTSVLSPTFAPAPSVLEFEPTSTIRNKYDDDYVKQEELSLMNVSEFLNDFDWKGSGNAAALEERLLNELAALEAANIHAIVESDDR